MSRKSKKQENQAKQNVVKSDIVSISAFLFANQQTDLKENSQYMSVFNQISPGFDPNTHSRSAAVIFLDSAPVEIVKLAREVYEKYRVSGSYDTPEITKLFEQNFNIEIELKH